MKALLLPAVARRRIAIATAIIALHTIVAVPVLWSQQPVRQDAIPVVMTVRAIAVPAMSHQVERDAPIDAGLTAPVIEIATPATEQPPVCDLPAILRGALLADPAAMEALAATAAGSEHAIMAWNGGWIDRPETLALRRTVGAVLRTTRGECLDEALIGPRLIFIAVSGTTVTVAFGSGSWSWRSLS